MARFSDIIAAAVLSGNRNFEGRIHALVRANYLASPPLVVAYALAGTVSSLIDSFFFLVPPPQDKLLYFVFPICMHLHQVDIDFEKEPIGKGRDGNDVYFKDIWPSNEEIAEVN